MRARIGTARSGGGHRAASRGRLVALVAVGLVLAGCWCPRALADGGPGSLLGWGQNYFGVLGNEETSESRVPVQVPAGDFPPGTTFAKVDVSEYLAQALSTDGRLFDWGEDNYGQLGDGEAVEKSGPVEVAAPAGTAFTQASAGSHFSLAVAAGGVPYGWGQNGSGELGDGTTTDSALPVAVSGGAMPSGTTLAQVAAGQAFSLGLSSSGHLYTWGDWFLGALGNGATTDALAPVAVSAGAIPPGTTFTQIAAGDFFALALSSTGHVYAWGSGESGELGNGSTTDSTLPVAVSEEAIPPGTTFTQIAAGNTFALALTSTGEVYGWGAGDAGQLGTGGTSSSPVPVPVALNGLLSPGETVTQIAAGNTFALALTSSGRVLAWGWNQYGELGDGSGGEEALLPVEVALPAGTTIDAVASNSEADFSLAIVGDLAIPADGLPGGTAGTAYDATLAGTGGAPPYRWSAERLPPGLALGPDGRLGGTPSVPGSYFPTLTLTDADGLTVHREVPIMIDPAPPPGQGTEATSPAAGAPTLTRLKESHRRWRELGSPGGAVPVGTSFSFDLDRRATVALAFEELVPRRKGGRRTVRRGTLSFAAGPGKATRRFGGRVSGRELAPGRYRLTAVATDSRRQSSAPRSLSFAIVR